MRVSVRLAWAAASFLVVGLGVVPAARAAGGGQPSTLYVDVTAVSGACSDSGSGAQALPFCTLQQAASVARPGDTILVSADSLAAVKQGVTFSQSGSPSQPITVAWSGAGARPVFAGGGTGSAVFTFNDVHDITVSGLQIEYGGVDGVDVAGSQDITLDGMRLQLGSTSPASVAAVSVNGSSSSVTVSRSLFWETGVNGTTDGVRVLPGAAGVTITTDILNQPGGGTPVSVSGASGVNVTSSTVSGACGDVAITGTSSAVLENNEFEGNLSCTSANAAAVTVDDASASSVSSDYNLFTRLPAGSAYSWAGTSYSDVPSFSAAAGQGAHDTMETSAGIPAGESPGIDSADCTAPGELATDSSGKPHVDDPLVPDTGAGTCAADRGAVELQDTMPAITSTLSPVVSAVPAGITPATVTVTITSPATSNFGYPVSYAVDFGDGSAPVPAGASATGLAASHQYTAPGLYTVTITGTDANGATRQGGVGQFYALSAEPVRGSLTATPRGLSTGSVLPDEASYTATYGSEAWQVASTMLSYGDGTPAASPTSYSSSGDLGWPAHVFAKPGTYTATLTVTDRAGRVTTTKTALTVGDEVKDLYTARDFAKTVPAHGTIKVPLSTLARYGSSRGGLVNVIVTNPKQAGWVIMYPDGTRRPNLATVQFRAGQSAANSALATGATTIDFYNDSNGTVGLEVDTYATDVINKAGSYDAYKGVTYTPVTPSRVLSTTRIAAGRNIAFPVAGRNGVPASATDVVLDITSTASAAAGHFITWAEKNQAHTQLPGAYWSKAQPVTGLVMTPVDGRVVLSNNSAGTASFTADIVGYYTPSPSVPGVFVPTTPARVLKVTIAGKQAVKLAVAGKAGIQATGTSAVMVNLTAVGASAGGTIIGYRDGTARPGITSLTYTAGSTAVNTAIVAVGTDGAIDLYNSGPKPVTLAVDLTGFYYAY